MGWGDAGQYYAKDPRDAVARDKVGRQWEQELLRANPHARLDVERAVKQWNPIVRDLLRNETGLRLSTPGDVRTVPVRVVDGLPVPLQDLLKDLPELVFLLLSLSEIEQAIRGTAFLSGEYDRIARLVPTAAAHAARDDVARTHAMAVELLARLDALRFREQWKSIDEDLLGAYFFHAPMIHIYWVPIGLMAGVLRVPVETLTLVVLAHELAHAYTHLGSDIDHARWDTKAFAATDLAVVEGLAEFYCKAVCDRLTGRASGVRPAFDALQECSSDVYRTWHRWVRPDADPGEVVRTTMIESRRTPIYRLGTFEEAMEEYRRTLTGKRRQQA